MSGLPVNTFSQAAEYRKRYLASLALSAQTDAYNLQANQVYRQTGQASRPPDMRTTTEKLADLERLKVDLRNGFLEITDGTNANEAVEQMTPDEIVFASQQLPAIIANIKPQFARGAPANALLIFLRALRRKFLQTNGVSFSAQEATAQQILNAIQAGVNVMGANGGPFAIAGAGGMEGPPPPPMGPGGFMPEGPPPRPAPRPAPEQGRPTAPAGQEGNLGQQIAGVSNFKRDPEILTAAANWGPNSMEEWEAYPIGNEFAPNYPNSEDTQVAFLKMWARAQAGDIQMTFDNFERKGKLKTLKKALLPGVVAKLSQVGSDGQELDPFDETYEDFTSSSGIGDINQMSASARVEPRGMPAWTTFEAQLSSRNNTSDEIRQMVRDWNNNRHMRAMPLQDDQGNEITVDDLRIKNKGRIPIERTNLQYLYSLEVPPKETRGKGVGRAQKQYLMRNTPSQPSGMGLMRRPMEPASRYPRGREILGYGLVAPRKKQTKPIKIDMSQGLFYETTPYYVPFGKYVINPDKLSSGIFDVKTLGGSKINKYPQRQLSPSLSKIMNRMIGGRMPDEYDCGEMDLEDQNFLYNLANDAKINERLKLKTPKRSKEGEEGNKFEILKGQIMAGNDSKELVKEFKQMLVRFSNDGRIKKTEAREILLDLAALGY